ncbi:MAG: hypothetical protein WCI55_13245 [Armatimonadota bacterium]
MLSWLLLNQVSVPDFDFSVRSKEGLVVSAKGIPIIRGSGFQYYAPGWSKGYYSSRWRDQAIRRIDENSVEMKFDEGGASGTVTYRRSGNRLTVDYDFNWSGADAALIELNHGLVWVPPFQNGTINLYDLKRTLPQLPPVGGLDKRILGSPTKQTQLVGSLATITLNSSDGVSTFDGRKYDQDWAEASPVYWQGNLALPVSKGTTSKVRIEYRFEVKDQPKVDPKRINVTALPINDALLPDESIPELIPSPRMSFLDWRNTLTISNLWKLPAGRPKFFDLFRSELEKRFEMPEVGALENRVSFDGGMSDFKKPEGTYHIKITKDSISVYGQEVAGLRNGIYRLVQMAFVKDGKICLPTGVIEDEPRSDFRGVHLFVGPQAPEFHQKLWTNVLRPLGFNKVVLQCERTDWDSAPGIHTSISMKKEDLAKLFQWYRGIEVEPIPLIQSFGHMGWLFANGMNKDLAINPQVPYTLDPRKPGAKELIGKVWDEAASLLKPRTIHVGLDEVDMLGFPTKNPALKTELWQNMLPHLGSVAKRNNANLMLWGDEGLAPSEAIDAANGDDKDNAFMRRKAIPKGAIIADWHYKADQNHVPFLKSLQKWKLEGFQPIASSWYRPENIRGFGVAADVEKAGTLQTTWAGYESNEVNMLKNLKQFSAMVLAGDYGWSGRLEKIEELPYDPVQVFGKMYNPHQSPVSKSRALLFGRGELFECGGVKFSQLEGSALRGISATNGANTDLLEVGLSGSAKELAVALACDVPSPTGEAISEMTISYKDGTQDKIPLLYGLHLLAAGETGSTFFGERKLDRTCFRVALKPKELKGVSFQALNRYSGLRVDGVTLIPIKGKKNPS